MDITFSTQGCLRTAFCSSPFPHQKHGLTNVRLKYSGTNEPPGSAPLRQNSHTDLLLGRWSRWTNMAFSISKIKDAAKNSQAFTCPSPSPRLVNGLSWDIYYMPRDAMWFLCTSLSFSPVSSSSFLPPVSRAQPAAPHKALPGAARCRAASLLPLMP